jgi:hypothetical protein
MVKSMIEKSSLLSKLFVIIINIIYIFSLDEDNEEPENYSLEDIKTKLMVLDEKIADDMWFI